MSPLPHTIAYITTLNHPTLYNSFLLQVELLRPTHAQRFQGYYLKVLWFRL